MNKNAVSSWIFLVLSVLSLSSKASADDFGDVYYADAFGELTCDEIDQPSKLCLMTLKKAESYCEQQGKRLPTVRELAAYAVRYGAEIIIEHENWGKCTPAMPGYICVPPNYKDWGYISLFENNVVGGFHYSKTGYRPPNDFGAREKGCFWAAPPPYSGRYTFVFCHDAIAIGSDGVDHWTGWIRPKYLTDTAAVTCFPE